MERRRNLKSKPGECSKWLISKETYHCQTCGRRYKIGFVHDEDDMGEHYCNFCDKTGNYRCVKRGGCRCQQIRDAAEEEVEF